MSNSSASTNSNNQDLDKKINELTKSINDILALCNDHKNLSTKLFNEQALLLSTILKNSEEKGKKKETKAALTTNPESDDIKAPKQPTVKGARKQAPLTIFKTKFKDIDFQNEVKKEFPDEFKKATDACADKKGEKNNFIAAEIWDAISKSNNDLVKKIIEGK